MFAYPNPARSPWRGPGFLRCVLAGLACCAGTLLLSLALVVCAAVLAAPLGAEAASHGLLWVGLAVAAIVVAGFGLYARELQRIAAVRAWAWLVVYCLLLVPGLGVLALGALLLFNR